MIRLSNLLKASVLLKRAAVHSPKITVILIQKNGCILESEVALYLKEPLKSSVYPHTHKWASD